MHPDGETHLLPKIAMDLWQMNDTKKSRLGKWDVSKLLEVDKDYKSTKIKRHFKIGVIVVC